MNDIVFPDSHELAENLDIINNISNYVPVYNDFKFETINNHYRLTVSGDALKHIRACSKHYSEMIGTTTSLRTAAARGQKNGATAQANHQYGKVAEFCTFYFLKFVLEPDFITEPDLRKYNFNSKNKKRWDHDISFTKNNTKYGLEVKNSQYSITSFVFSTGDRFGNVNKYHMDDKFTNPNPNLLMMGTKIIKGCKSTDNEIICDIYCMSSIKDMLEKNMFCLPILNNYKNSKLCIYLDIQPEAKIFKSINKDLNDNERWTALNLI